VAQHLFDRGHLPRSGFQPIGKELSPPHAPLEMYVDSLLVRGEIASTPRPKHPMKHLSGKSMQASALSEIGMDVLMPLLVAC
jgi:hypothetical protein